MNDVRKLVIPESGDHVSLVGSTGSGKTRFGMWLFSHFPFKTRPHIIFDFKGDDFIAQIDRAKEISIKDKPRHPGLYVVKPLPHEDASPLLWHAWQQGKTGIYIDEGYGIPRYSPGSHALKAIMTQGRSLGVTTLTLTQRPLGCITEVFSEASHFGVFRLNKKRDAIVTVGEYTPDDDPVWDFERPVAEYHSRWYNVKRDWSSILTPAPSDDTILDRFDDALKGRTRTL